MLNRSAVILYCRVDLVYLNRLNYFINDEGFS